MPSKRGDPYLVKHGIQRQMIQDEKLAVLNNTETPGCRPFRGIRQNSEAPWTGEDVKSSRECPDPRLFGPKVRRDATLRPLFWPWNL